jgi:Rrf2 family protein
VRVTAKSDYALRALVEIARRAEDGPVSADELGRVQEIPRGFLQAILADLRRAGIVSAQRGPAGGWKLSQEPSDITVADVIRAVDGPLVSVHGDRPEAVKYKDSVAALQLVWIASRSALRDILENVTVAQLATDALPAEVSVRTEDRDAWQPR